MHELVIVEGILDTVIPEVKKYDVEKILSIRLKIGELSGIVPSCVHEYFRIAAKGTIAEGARIIIEKTPIRITCRDCGFEGEIRKGTYACPQCGSTGFRIISGKEYFVDSVEAE
ncbi:MAG: hydrogenase maturation nickel metallochaperone HypA [Lachnospiraceae bacterium]|jgi:hydrogenase nickel incorporation protein HypA/HybF|nr:hydrogenase maturation nickel metallochaperone HypA [Lachnospiraceae bacterium]MBR2531432.1 hydrogenase maturation nickel metallochaperone HypA [Lachnospiraceae bacterium]